MNYTVDQVREKAEQERPKQWAYPPEIARMDAAMVGYALPLNYSALLKRANVVGSFRVAIWFDATYGRSARLAGSDPVCQATKFMEERGTR